MTTDNVAEVMDLVNDLDSLQHGTLTASGIIPSPRFRAIKDKCSTKRGTAYECASYYVQCHIQPSWAQLADRLYHCGEFAAVEKLKPFLTLRGKQLGSITTPG